MIMAAESSVQSTIDQAWAAANSARSAAEGYAAQAVTAATAFLNQYGEYQLNVGRDATIDTDFSRTLSDIAKETSNTMRDSIPDAYRAIIRDAIGDLTVYSIYSGSARSDNAPELIGDLANRFNSTFGFASEINSLSNSLLSNLYNLTYGVPAEIESQIRARAEDALARQSIQAEQDIIASTAARGFPMPPGIVSKQIEKTQEEAIRAKAGTTRDVYVNQAERAFNATSVYIQAYNQLQSTVTGNFVNYLNAVASARNDMESTVRTITDAIVKLRGAVIASYSFAVQEKDLLLREAVARGELTMEQRKIDLENFKSTATNTATAAMAAARTMGDLAAAAVGSQNTMATIAYQTIAQDAGG